MKTMMVRQQKQIISILTYGCLWGITEATFGWIIHALHLRYLTPFLITAGVFFMSKAATRNCRPADALFVAIIAALIKSLNIFLLKGLPLYWVLNPAFHILGEGIITATLLNILYQFRRNASSFLLLNKLTSNYENYRNRFGRG